MTIEELGTRCRGSVSLTINGHRDCYESKMQYLGPMTLDHEDIAGEAISSDPAVPLYVLHFYPRNPVGFDVIAGNSLQECLDAAEKILIEAGL